MKRVVGLLALMGITLAAPSVTQVWAGGPSKASLLARDLRTLVAGDHRLVRRDSELSLQRDRPLSQARRPAPQTAQELALDAIAFNPATLSSSESGVEDNATADSRPFRTDHAVAYSASGRITGYYQRADWTPAGLNDSVIFRYQGSIYSSSDSSKAAFQDGVTQTQTLPEASQPYDCTSDLQAPCSLNAYGLAAGAAMLYAVVQVNRCLIEVGAEFDETVYNAQQQQIDQTFGTIVVAGYTAANAICGTDVTVVPLTPGQTIPTPNATLPASAPILFRIDALRAHRHHSADPNAPSFRTAKVGKTIYLYVYYTVQSAPTKLGIAVTFTLTHRHQIIGTRSFPTKQLETPPVSYYDFAAVSFRYGGTYNFIARVTVGSKFQEQSMKFRIVKARKRA